jgi:hypothetical protein
MDLIMCSLTSIKGNSQKLDGGAMFGNVPKAILGKLATPNKQSRIPLFCRALLIQVEGKEHVLLNSLKKISLSDADIDFVILSHLQFNRAGGLLSARNRSVKSKLLFPKADYLVSKTGWERVCTRSNIVYTAS